jgi:hypothetical protein
VFLGACGGVTNMPTVGGESHFLRECGDGCGAGLECISNVCTRSCLVGKEACDDLAVGAECTAASIEPGAVAVCDLACGSASDCARLDGTDWACDSGFCRQRPEPPMPTGGSSGAGGGMNGAGGGGSGPGPWQPPALCSLPFEVGTCEAAIPVYAMVDGECVPQTYGGCDGNDNRFGTLEECLRACAGAPQANACPEGRVPQKLCLGCGPAGGCEPFIEACALPCMIPDDCGVDEFPDLTCREGFCQIGGCL